MRRGATNAPRCAMLRSITAALSQEPAPRAGGGGGPGRAFCRGAHREPGAVGTGGAATRSVVLRIRGAARRWAACVGRPGIVWQRRLPATAAGLADARRLYASAILIDAERWLSEPAARAGRGGAAATAKRTLGSNHAHRSQPRRHARLGDREPHAGQGPAAGAARFASRRRGGDDAGGAWRGDASARRVLCRRCRRAGLPRRGYRSTA